MPSPLSSSARLSKLPTPFTPRSPNTRRLIQQFNNESSSGSTSRIPVLLNKSSDSLQTSFRMSSNFTSNYINNNNTTTNRSNLDDEVPDDLVELELTRIHADKQQEQQQEQNVAPKSQVQQNIDKIREKINSLAIHNPPSSTDENKLKKKSALNRSSVLCAVKDQSFELMHTPQPDLIGGDDVYDSSLLMQQAAHFVQSSQTKTTNKGI